MTTRDWGVQAVASLLLAVWLWFVIQWFVVGHKGSIAWIPWAVGGVFLSGAFVGIFSVRKLSEALFRGSGPILEVAAGFLFIALLRGEFGFGFERYLFAAVVVSPIGILGASIGAWLKSKKSTAGA